MKLISALTSEFEKLVGFQLALSAEYQGALEALCNHLSGKALRAYADRRERLIAHINSKFEFNREGIARVFAHAASFGIIFNFHEKNLVQSAFDNARGSTFSEVIEKCKSVDGLQSQLNAKFRPISAEETLNRFKEEVLNPSSLRIAKGERPISNEILVSAFSAFVYSSCDEQVMHQFFDASYDSLTYESSYWLQLRRLHPQLYSRKQTLSVARISQEFATHCGSLEKLRNSVFAHILSSYLSIENHGHLVFWLEPIEIEGRDVAWELASDIMLFAEKHDEVKLKNTYFKSKQIELETATYIDDLTPATTKFELANEGFSYRDTFVCPPFIGALVGSEVLLLLFQKNKRDETAIPCPACRSHSIQGNSYPSLGVRSWECRNLLCPDRSKYNRGKRYSFKAILMQEAIDEEESQIPAESVRAWSRDVQPGRKASEALEMLIRHYSLHGDGVTIFDLDVPFDTYGRSVISLGSITPVGNDLASNFFNSAWFNRYAFPMREESEKSLQAVQKECIGAFTLVQGNSATALSLFDENYFDGAVTSPPYYNAREYSKWPNIYCYLRDMLRIAVECFRVLRPGAPYLYNIFDYFDNERSIVFSAMGDKRLILSAYTVDIFRRVGFVLAGSITWDKGDIEGKRGFNAGNFSPYYQAPFNCWEHILIFVKPGLSENLEFIRKLPAVLRAQPVSKMVKGQNTHGHTAPYPAEVPVLLKALVPVGARVLDPFGGSGTTARAMLGHASETVCIEQMEEYCELAKRMYAEEAFKLQNSGNQTVLFES
jgi:DNA modification methylase